MPDPPDAWFPEYPEPCPDIPSGLSDDLLVRPLTKSSVLEDIDLYFTILRFAYSGYGYFGGDESFFPARERVKAEITRMPDNVSIPVIANIVVGELGFIADLHSSFGRVRFTKDHAFCMDESIVFVRRNGEYFLDEVMWPRRVLSVSGESPSRYIKPSIDRNGRIVHRLAGLFDAGELGPDSTARLDLELSTIFGVKTVRSVALRCITRRIGLSGPSYAVNETGDYPVLRVSRCFPNGADDDSLDSFVADGARFASKPLLYLDCRGNIGGSDIYSYGFIEGLTGTKPNAYTFEADRKAPLIERLIEYMVSMDTVADEAEKETITRELIDRFVETKTYRSTWHRYVMERPRTLPHDGLIVAAADRGVASSGETMIQCLRLVQGSLILGTPTAGCCSFGNVIRYRLPRSGIEINIPVSFFMQAYGTREGEGIEPDLWMPPDEAKPRFEAMLERYGVDAILEVINGIRE